MVEVIMRVFPIETRMTAAELAERSQVSRSTVGALMRYWADDGLLAEELGEKGEGRAPILWSWKSISARAEAAKLEDGWMRRHKDRRRRMRAEAGKPPMKHRKRRGARAPDPAPVPQADPVSVAAAPPLDLSKLTVEIDPVAGTVLMGLEEFLHLVRGAR